MQQVQTLDLLISKKSFEFVSIMKLACSKARSEEDIKMETEKQIAYLQKDAGISLDAKYEYTVATGRIDSVYSRVLIEYKNPNNPSSCIGERTTSAGTKKVVEQIQKRFASLEDFLGQAISSSFLGVGFDGRRFIFVRYRSGKWDIQEPVLVTQYSSARFFWALFNLGKKGKAFSPDNLSIDFGAESDMAKDGIQALFSAIQQSTDAKTDMLFRQWQVLFSEVCGYDIDLPNPKILDLARNYAVDLSGKSPALLFFCMHTYFALFMKLLVSEILAYYHRLPTPIQKMTKAPDSERLKNEIDDLEAGSIFRHLNIRNFLEGDLFAWYSGLWSPSIEAFVRKLIRLLDSYNPGTLSEDPYDSKDLLKRVYQELFPKSTRHDLGEYYTPDWLAEHTLDNIGYTGNPEKSLIDPACGSGTFLVAAINRIRKWFDDNRDQCHYDESDLCKMILRQVVGFDLNPLAVMAARANVLIALRDLISYLDEIEIPVYLCDSIRTPSRYGDLITGHAGQCRRTKDSRRRLSASDRSH